MKEIYKEIKGTNGDYLITNTGRVISLKNNKMKELGLYDNNYGYLNVILYIQGKSRPKKVHRLVAEAFIPNPNNFPCVNHKDENRHNNFVENLEWCTHLYNNHYGKRIERIQNKLSKKVYQYDYNNNLIKKWKSASEIQRELGYCQTSICSCCNNKRISAYGFLWKYK